VALYVETMSNTVIPGLIVRFDEMFSGLSVIFFPF
jgi:hypothetical protein